jgi:hypothetical protein
MPNNSPAESKSLSDAVNYLLSGPSGLGQNFSGFSAYEPAYLSGTFREPYTQAISTTTTAPTWYVAPIGINNVAQLNVINGKTPYLQWTFTTATVTPPFAVGQTIRGNDIWDPSQYQGNNGVVVTCSTTSVITKYVDSLAWEPITTYGSIFVNNDGIEVSTDANARVTVTGPTEQVFISSQLALQSGYSCTTTSTFDVTVQINRYSGNIDTASQGAVDYFFEFDKTVSQQTTNHTVAAGTGTVSCGQNIFTTVLDQPNFGYYWYICEILFNTKPTYRYDGLNNIVTGTLYAPGLEVSGTSADVTATFTATVVNVSSSGVGGQLTVKIDGVTDYVDTKITVANGGSGYSVGDTLKILGTDLGGISPDDDMAITLTQIDYPGDVVPQIQTVGLRSLTAQVIKQ